MQTKINTTLNTSNQANQTRQNAENGELNGTVRTHDQEIVGNNLNSSHIYIERKATITNLPKYPYKGKMVKKMDKNCPIQFSRYICSCTISIHLFPLLHHFIHIVHLSPVPFPLTIPFCIRFIVLRFCVFFFRFFCFGFVLSLFFIFFFRFLCHQA